MEKRVFNFNLPLDEDQKKAVFSEENTVVSAGAGSGKTRVLAYRYFRLVASGQAQPENILTITFTRKAAAEMYERIYGLFLENKETFPPIQRALSKFDKAQISTIDSFCSQVARNWCSHFGVASGFSQDDAKVREEVESLAFDFLLKNSKNPALGELIFTGSFDRVWKEFLVPIGLSLCTLGEDMDFSALGEKQFRLLEEHCCGSIKRLRSIAEQIAGIPKGQATAADTASLQAELFLSKLTGRDQPPEEILELVNRAFDYRKPSGKAEVLLLLREYTEAFREEKERFGLIVPALESRDLIREVLRLTGEYKEIILDSKRRNGVLSFSDVMSMALETLKQNRELRRYYKNQFTHIMIDEFQDTNLQQKELVYLLAERLSEEGAGVPGEKELEKGKLFFVGDEKQSIYRFRGADVSVFKNLVKEITLSGGKPLALAKNYRSEPGLVDLFNRLFSDIMAGPGEPWEAEFSPLEKRNTAAHSPAFRIFYKSYNQEESEEELLSGDDSEALFLARYIRDSVEKKSLLVFDEGKNAVRPAGYEDFAVLLRSTGGQIRYEKMLRRLGVPYTTQNIRSLFLEAPLNDYYNLFQVLVYPEDRSAYAALLRSPFVNLSDETMLRLLLEEEKPGGPFSFEKLPWEAVEEEERKYRLGRELYFFMKERIDRVPIRSLVAEGWERFGYRFSLLRRQAYHPYLDFFRYIASLAEAADRSGSPMVLFLDTLRDNLGKYERLEDLSIVQEEGRGVNILTIHKSKGLEFPVVIIANSGNTGAGRGDSGLYHFSETYGLTLKLVKKTGDGKKKGINYFYKLSEEEERRKELAETKRLLYVAATRAKDHLFVSGCHHRNNRNDEKALLNMVFNALGGIDAAEGYIEEIEDLKEADLFAESAGSEEEKLLSVLTPLYEQPPVPKPEFPRLEYTATELNARHAASAVKGIDIKPGESLPALKCDTYLEEEGLEALFGTLCHWFLEQALKGRDLSGENPPENLLGRTEGVKRDLLISEARSCTEGFLASPLGKEAMETRERFPEYQFLLKADTEEGVRIIRGTADLVFLRKEEAVLIDFKTDKRLNPEEYKFQLALYERGVSEIFRKPVKVFLVYLRGTRIIPVEIPEIFPISESLFYRH